MIIECLLLSASLCRAVKDRPVVALATAHTIAITADGIESARERRIEVDPISRILIGRNPTWARMAPIGAAYILAETWLAERMRTSRHGWERKIWWLPQVIGIGGNVWGVVISSRGDWTT